MSVRKKKCKRPIKEVYYIFKNNRFLKEKERKKNIKFGMIE